MQKNLAASRVALDAITSEAIDLLLRKNHDYGNSWSRQGLAGVLVRLSDKFYRWESLANTAEAIVADENIGQTLWRCSTCALPARL